MRIADVDLILIPEWLALGECSAPDDHDHWISRWQRNLSTARWLQENGVSPSQALIDQANETARPVVVITHGAGAAVLIDCAEALGATTVIGAFMVAPAVDWPRFSGTAPTPARLPFASVIIAADNQPDATPVQLADFARQVDGYFVPAGATYRIDSNSGHGPWPEGLMRLGWFLKRLGDIG